MVTHLAEACGVSKLTAISDACGLPPSPVHRLLGLPAAVGWVVADPMTKEYRLGPELYGLAGRVTASFDLVTSASRHLDRVLGSCGETVLLGVYLPGRNRMMFAARRDPPHPLQYRVDLHTPLSLLWGASGRSILAYLGAEERRDVLAEPEPSPVTGQPPDTTELCEHLGRIRRDGFALSCGQRLDGAVGLAAPIIRRGDQIVGNLCLTIPGARFQRDRLDALVEQLTAVASEIASTHP